MNKIIINENIKRYLLNIIAKTRIYNIIYTLVKYE